MRTTQKERIAHLLRVRGRQGVHSFELHRDYIADPSKRVEELKDDGWKIGRSRERLNGTAWGTRYVLVSEPEIAGTAAATASPSPDGKLFKVGRGQYGFADQENAA